MKYLLLTSMFIGALIKSAPLQKTDYKPLTIPEIIEREAKINGVEPDLIHAIIKVESGYQVDAVSHKGARGIMQVMPEHFDYFGYQEGDLLDPEKNIVAGVRLLREELNRFGNEFDALRAYNCGSPKAKKYKKCGAEYVMKVKANL
jgi:soluble lytic murein transglycosylase-like protein